MISGGMTSSSISTPQIVTSSRQSSAPPEPTRTLVPSGQEGQQGIRPQLLNSSNSAMAKRNPPQQSSKSQYVKVWEGNLYGKRHGQPAFITRLEGYRSPPASET
ncbi:unnamed protein product [Cuscuta epithymum]|nr:unnamed protein product [Cuscuta epithymum]